MSSPSVRLPVVQHSFDGDVKILNSTFDRRMEIRKTLQTLQQDLQKMVGRSTQIKAEIKLRTEGDTREQTYHVTISSPGFDVDAFEKVRSDSETMATGASNLSSSPQQGTSHVNGQQATPTPSTPRPQSRRANDDADDDSVEIRPFKRARTDGSNGDATDLSSNETKDTDSLLRETLAHLKKRTSPRIDELHSLMKEWQTEWKQQGGWLFDNISKANTSINRAMTSTTTSNTALEKKLGSVQDVLGQSMNTASASTLAELTNINRLIPWLENCRKSSADKVQAREEKWRTSSATFHDQARREREAAEKRIEKKLEEQRELLMKVARASGIDISKIDVPVAASPEQSREASLGAQLTAELNMAAKPGDDDHETINIDD